MLHVALNVIKSHHFRDDIKESEPAPTVMYCITACLTCIHCRRYQHYPPITLSKTARLYKVGGERQRKAQKKEKQQHA